MIPGGSISEFIAEAYLAGVGAAWSKRGLALLRFVRQAHLGEAVAQGVAGDAEQRAAWLLLASAQEIATVAGESLSGAAR